LFSFALFSSVSTISAISFFPSLKSSTVNLSLNFPAEMYVTDALSFFRSNIFLILVTPSSSRHLIVILCFNSCLPFLFSVIFFMASILFSGMNFFRRELFFFASLRNSSILLNSFSIFSLISSASSPRICLNATFEACSIFHFCITSFFSFELTLRSDRWTLLPEMSRILQTIFLFGTTYCRISLIRPGAISDEMIVASCPFGSSTVVIVFVTSLTVHSNRSPSSMIKLDTLFI